MMAIGLIHETYHLSANQPLFGPVSVFGLIESDSTTLFRTRFTLFAVLALCTAVFAVDPQLTEIDELRLLADKSNGNYYLIQA